MHSMSLLFQYNLKTYPKKTCCNSTKHNSRHLKKQTEQENTTRMYQINIKQEIFCLQTIK